MAKVTSEDLGKSLSIIRDNAMDTIRTILHERLGVNGSMNLDYYCKNYCEKYDFLAINNGGYGKAVHIDTIEIDNNGEPTFNMIDEDEYDWDERELGDFNAVELYWVLTMLEGAFEVIDDMHKGVVLPKGCFDYDEIEED